LKQGKIWGATDEFFRNAIVSAHYLEIKKNGYSSKHRHAHKFNVFYVISGELEITIWRDRGMKDVTVVKEGGVTGVSPGFYHRFKGLTDVRCVEIYQVILQEPDIERCDHGGTET